MSEEAIEEQTEFERYTQALADLYYENDVYFPGAIYMETGAPVPFDRKTGLPFWCGDRLTFEHDSLRTMGADEIVYDFGDVRDFHNRFLQERDFVQDLLTSARTLVKRLGGES